MEAEIVVPDGNHLAKDWLEKIWCTGAEDARPIDKNIRIYFRKIQIQYGVELYHTQASTIGLELVIGYLEALVAGPNEKKEWFNNRLPLSDVTKLVTMLQAAVLLGVQEVLEMFLDHQSEVLLADPERYQEWIAIMAANFLVFTGQVDIQ